MSQDQKNPNPANDDNQIDLLQKQVDQLQIKVYEEKKAKWYKNPSLLISLIALASSLFFSVSSIISQQNQSKEQRLSEASQSIATAITDLIAQEESFMAISTNPNSNINAITNAGLSYQSKASSILDKISSDLEKVSKEEIEPNTLVNYGRFLFNAGRIDESFEIFSFTLDSMEIDPITKQTCYRSLANIYANPSFSRFDSIYSRELRGKDIEITRTLNGSMKNSYLSRSYELWARDEYFLIGNIKEGNRLIDSAKYHTNQLPNTDGNKPITINMLTELYNYYNDILVLNNIGGEYSFQDSNNQKGKAFISAGPMGVSISIDEFQNGKLISRYNGQGGFIDVNNIRLELNKIKVYSNPSNGSLILTCKPGKLLTGTFSAFDKSPVTFYLRKKG